MIGAMPSKITAVQASPIGRPHDASVSRIASSPFTTAHVCRRMRTPTVTRTISFAVSSRRTMNHSDSRSACAIVIAMGCPFIRHAAAWIGSPYPRGMAAQTKRTSVPGPALVQAQLARAQEEHGIGSEQVERLGLQEIMVPMIARRIVGHHEQMVLGIHQPDMGHDYGDHHEGADQEAAQPGINPENHPETTEKFGDEAKPHQLFRESPGREAVGYTGIAGR